MSATRRPIPAGKPNRITIDALKFYVPLFQEGYAAEERLLQEYATLTANERNHLETVMKLKELAAKKIAVLAGPLITREINKIIAASHLRNREDLFDILYYAGLDGMKRGLRRFDVDKINASSTNYLFQWIVTYAKKELIQLEAPFGIPPSRFQRYKKISAVRKNLSEAIGHYATNDEVFAYFQSGQADLKTMNGRVADREKASQANLAITFTLVEEQERFEKEMLAVELLEPLEDYSSRVQLSEHDSTPFSETVFGVFVTTYNVTEVARVVIMSDLSARDLTEAEVTVLQALPQKDYKNVSTQWKNLVKDINGPFYEFLKENMNVGFNQFDIQDAIGSIEHYDKVINSQLYSILFENEKIVRL
jgi:hypothetical protein